MKQLQHTPEGVRDIYQVECSKKLILEEKIRENFIAYGYHDIQTPTFEFFDVFRKEIGTIPSKELYKFFDKEGNTLVLRPDITPSIARAAATLFPDHTMPTRLCYTGNTFINYTESYQGRLRETTQMGAELIGSDSVASDAEMIALAIDCLTSIGLEDFQISIGNVDYFQSLMEEAKLTKKEELRIRELITNKNFLGVEENLDQIHVDPSAEKALVALEDLFGGVEVLAFAKQLAPNEKAMAAVLRLEEIYRLLEVYGVEKHVNFDFGMNDIYGYYTGIIFRGYTFGTGDAIVKGGRYDHLIEKFGAQAPSIGFAFVIDQLMNALSRQKVPIPSGTKNTVLLYESKYAKKAISLAKELRNQGIAVELVARLKENSLDAYISLAKESYAGKLIYLDSKEAPTMIDPLTDERTNIIGV